MATVTVTETGVRLTVTMGRRPDGDIVTYSAQSITDVPLVPGRNMMGIVVDLTPAQADVVASVLDFIEAKVKAEWNIP